MVRCFGRQRGLAELLNESVPLTSEDDGVIRVEGTRVPLDTGIGAFRDGATAEEIAEQYPTLALGVVYQVIGYYLRYREEMDAYLANRAQQAADTRARNEALWPAGGIRERLLARRK